MLPCGKTLWLVPLTVWVFLVCPIEASHFRGGIITWRPLNNRPSANQTNVIPEIEISYRMAWRRSAGGHTCTDESIASRSLLSGEGVLSCGCSGLSHRLSYICTDFSTSEDWTTGINSVQYQPNIPIFEIWFSGCCWISLRNGGSSWDIGTTVNLTVRSDNGRINSSPTTTTMPIVRLQRECNNTITIPVSDPDGDDIRCFWATRRCGGICNPLPGAILNQESCELTWNVEDSASIGLYGVAIEIQDFPSTTATEPLSTIPLQFLVDLFSGDESCVSQPVFIPPTRVQGSCVGVPENTTYHEPIVARTGSSDVRIEDIDTVSPSGVLKSGVLPYPGGLRTDYHVNITWTPDSTRLEEILCFTPRDNVGSVGQQSCITLVTGTTPPQLNDSSLLPANGSLVFPVELLMQLQFDQDIVRPIRPTLIRIFDDTDTLVYQLDAQFAQQVDYVEDNVVAFTIPVRFLEEQVSYYILMDPGIARSTTFCGVESSSITDKDFWTFAVRDVTPPGLIFDDPPPRTNENVTITWTLNEPAVATCTLSSPTGTRIVSCGESWEGMFLTEGYHTLHVTATDTAGNIAQPRQVSWFVDLTPPVVDILRRPNSVTNMSDASFSFRCRDFGDSCQFLCGYSTTDQEPERVPCFSSFFVRDLMNNLEYRFSVIAEDRAGNVGEETTFSWIVDAEPPSISNLTSVTITCGLPFDPNVTGSPVVTDNQDLSVQLSYVDESRSDCTFSRLWTATDDAGNAATTRQSLIIDNQLGPQINIPTFRVLPCSDNIEAELDISNSGEGTPVFHPCDRPLQVTFMDDVAVRTCGQEFTRFWTVTDDCGSIVGAQQRIQILELVFPEAPANGEVNVELMASLSWPSYPGATNHRVFVWQYEDMRPFEPTTQTTGRIYRPSSPYPPSTRMLWQIEYVIAGDRRRRRQSDPSIIPSPVWGFVTRSFPDLTVNDVILPNFAFSGQTVEVSWEVQNIGQMGISPVGWFDTVYFSISPEPTNLVAMRTERMSRFVDPADGYFFTTTWTLPEDLIGTFHVFVETDRYRNLEDFHRANNLRRADSTLEVRLTPPPDLQVTSVVVPASSFSGFEIDVRWRVDNLGFGITAGDVWYDQIYLSEGGSLDRLLKTIRHDGVLSVGEGYSSITSVTVPARIFGDFSIIIVTDGFRQIYEHNFENNNELNSSIISVVLSPPADFQVTDITVEPNRLMSGDSVVVSWEVTNAGTGFPDFSYWCYLKTAELFVSFRDSWYRKICHRRPRTREALASMSSISGRVGSIRLRSSQITATVFEFTSEDNNDLSVDVEIVQRLPDLLISGLGVDVSTNNETGASTLALNWTVTNVGEGDTTRGIITDRVVLRQCSAVCSTQVLGSVVSVTSLPSGDAYTVTKAEFDVPTDITGAVQIQVMTDASSRHLESGSGSNFIAVDIEIPCLSPQLVISDIKTSTIGGESTNTARAGDEISIAWNVTNLGQIVSIANDSRAVLSLMRTGTPSELDVILLESNLLPGNSLPISSSLRLPIGLSGNVSFQIAYQMETSVCLASPSALHGPFVVQPPPTPNLQVTMVKWTPLVLGESITVSWTVTNNGNTMAAESSWYDQVVLGSSTMDASIDDVEILGSFPYTGLMEAGQSYTASKPLLIPQDLGGSLFVNVISSFELLPGDSTLLGRSQSSSDKPLVLPDPELPDLMVQDITGLPSNVSFGSSVTVTYEVLNAGSSTIASSWTDCIHLVQPFLQAQVGKVTHTGTLETGESYFVSFTFKIPFVLEGEAQVQITTDVTSQVRDSDRENNIGSSDNVNLYEGPMADLVPSIAANDVTLSSGAPFTFVYNITNVGGGDIEDTWIDAIYLSQDSMIDPFDVRLASSPTGAAILPGETIQLSVELSLPLDLPAATFHILVDLDSRGEIFEDDENNNIAEMAFEVIGGSSSDLAVTAVTVPSMASFGGNIEVDWSVENLGLQMVEGFKCDTVYISDDREWNIMDAQVGRVCQAFSLSASSNSEENMDRYSLDAPLPLVSSGEHFAIVRTRSNVRDSNVDNNIGIGDMGVTVSLPLLEIDTPNTDQISLYEDLAYRIPSVAIDETLIVELTSDADLDVNALFVRHNEIASASQFDASSQGTLSANQTVTVTPTRAGDYYLLVQNRGALDNAYTGSPSNIVLSARIAKFEILDVLPRQAAPLGLVTLTVQGTVFPEKISAKLQDSESGSELYAVGTYRFSSQELYVTFDVSNNNNGTNFNLNLNDKVEFPSALEMIQGIPGTVEVFVNNRRNLRPGEVGQVSIDVQNTGNTDVLTPLLTFAVTELGEARLIGAGRPEEWLSSHLFLATPSRGPGGILPPGSSTRFFFEVRSTTGIGSGLAELTLSNVAVNDPTIPNLFAEDKDLYRPFMFSDARWDRVWESFLEVTGPTHQTFIQQMSKVLNHLSMIGHRPLVVEEVILHQLNIVDGFGYYSSTIAHRDIASHPRERSILNLEVTREFDPQLSFRGVRGVFGVGWKSFWWNIKIVSVVEDTIIVEQDNQFIEFVRTDDEDVFVSFRGTITVNETEIIYNDAFASFTREVTFDASSLALMQIRAASDGTTLTFENNQDNLPVLVSTSSGYSLSVSYNSFNLVESLSLINRDGESFQTASYTYDNSGSYLETVTVDEDVRSYTYENDGALASFTDSNNRKSFLTYDVFGVLNSISHFDPVGGVISQSEISDRRDGSLTVYEFPSGRATDVVYTMFGDVGLSRTEGSPSVRLQQDTRSGSAAVLVGDHVASQRVYDANQNVQRIFDGNGDVTEVSQNALGLLNYFADGNRNRYDFSDDGNVRSLTFPDGSQETITSDENGFLQERINRDGTVSSFFVDEDGLVVQRVDEGEDEYFFMYNERGLVTEATNNVGTIRIAYTPSGRPRTVEYPDGKTFVYDYDDRGRRISLRDDGDYHVAFTYDVRDRVVQVSRGGDPSSAINIEYDLLGRIARKVFPNGCESTFAYRRDSALVSQVINSCSESILSQFDYGYNERELRNEINTTSGTWKIRYDGASQIVSWVTPDGDEVNIGYDSAGNRQFFEENGDVTSYTTNNLNQYTQVGDTQIRYDACGHVVGIDSPSGTAQYEFNAVDQLVASQVNGEECVYRYNAMGTLHDKSCSSGETTYYMDFFGNFGADVLIESSGGADVEYFHSPGIGLLSRRSQGGKNYYNFDGTGSVAEIFDAAGDVVASYEYDPFGNIITESGQADSLFQFSGQYGVLRLHEANLNFMRTRMYSEYLGRFISPDAYGYRGSPTNLYVYANNNPLLYTDPSGTIPVFLAAPLISAAISVGAYTVGTLVTGGEFTTGGFVGSFVGGAVTGIPAVSALSPFVSGAIGGAVADAVTQLIDNDRLSDFDVGQTLANSLLSGVINKLVPKKNFASNLGNALKRFSDVASKFINKLIKTFIKKGVQGVLDYLWELWEDFVEWVQSIDPNDILGPSGFGDARFIAADFTLDYRIRFENDVNATAPAQLVTVETYLDDNVDIATFHLGSFGFGNFSFDVESRRAILQTTIQFDDQVYVVRVTAGLDFVNRKATWRLQTLDPETGLPPIDPSIGFLPPNPENGTGEGEGFVTYSIRPMRSVNTYDVIEAEASIIFDRNDPIDTEPTFNTIDRDAPSTQNVSVITDVIDSGILALTVQSSDEGAGVKTVNVYSDDNGKMDLIATSPATERNIVLDLPTGTSYNLLILSEDHVGNLAAAARGSAIGVFFPQVEASCEGVNNCSGAGNCTSENLCQCIEGRYGNDCSQETPPKEPPIIGVTVGSAVEDKSFQLPVTVEVVSPTSNDVIDLRLVNILDYFSSTIGEVDGYDLVIPIEQSRDIVLQPREDISGDFVVVVNATVTDEDDVTVTRVADVPVFVTPVADVPSVTMEDVCFEVVDGNSTATLRINVTSGDRDYSEVLSVFISDPQDSSSYAGVYQNVTTTGAQVEVDISVPEMQQTALEVRVTATSVEIYNGDQATLNATFLIPPCGPADGTTEAPREVGDFLEPIFFG